MASKSIAGEYVSLAILTGVESAANTLTFEKLESGISIYDHVGWVLSRVEWRLTGGTLALFNGTGDALSSALLMSDKPTSLVDDDPAIYVKRAWTRLDFGTAANARIESTTWVDDYSNLPGGGLLVLPTPLYLGLQGSGLTGAATVYAKLFFKSIDMSNEDYFNLVQARQLLTNS